MRLLDVIKARTFRLLIGFTIAMMTAVCSIALIFFSPAPSHAQIPLPTDIFRSTQLEFAQVGDMNVAPVRVDGNILFQIAAPIPGGENASTTLSPIERRVQVIDFHLKHIIQDGFDPNTLEVSSQNVNNQITIVTNDKNLGSRNIMYVTEEDVEMAAQADPEQIGESWAAIIKQALLRAHIQRQPKYIALQILPSLATLLLMAGCSVLIEKLQYVRDRRYQFYQKQQQQYQGNNQNEDDDDIKYSEQLSLKSDLPNVAPSLKNVRASLKLLLPKISAEQHLVINAIGMQFLWAAQIAIWLIGFAIIFRRFPQVRHFSLWLWRVPIGIIAIPFGIGILQRIIDALIEAISDKRAQYIREKIGENYRLHKRLPTIKKVLHQINGYIAILAIIILFFYSLKLINIGILVIIAIAFLGQGVFQDFLQTYYILVEDQYGLTDTIQIQDINGQTSTGKVVDITLRATQLRYVHVDGRGEYITISHGKITKVTNLTRLWAQVNLKIDVAYSTDLDLAMDVMREVAEGMRSDLHWREYILEPPNVKGVTGFGDNSISIRVVMRTPGTEQWKVAREYRRRLKTAFDKADITIPFPQRSVWFENALPGAENNQPK